MNRLFRSSLAALTLCAALAGTAPAAAPVMPAAFEDREMPAGDAVLHVRIGGTGPAVLLLHGYGETGEMWAPLASELVKTHSVIVPDLRGMGLSTKPEGGYDKASQARGIHEIMVALGIKSAIVIGHDIGNMVAYAYAAQYPVEVTKLALNDAPVPGIPPWNEIVRSGPLWHFDFGGPDAERLVAGRERIYLDRFWNEFSMHRERIDEATRAFYASRYAQAGAMHAGFAQFAAFRQDAKDNLVFMKTKLTMPVLAVGGAGSFGPTMAVVMRNAATDVTEAVVPDAGHWLMEENPKDAVAIIMGFVNK